MENLYLIVGLGNPGRKYELTRHNAGFRAVERWAERRRVNWMFEKKFNARIGWGECHEHRVLVCRPETFMNASGDAVGAVADFYKLASDRMLVTVDDADLPLGEIRLRSRGSSGGHHGLESIEQRLGTRQFARQRLGIGRAEPGRREITDYVLSRFNAAETGLLEQVLDRACDQMDCWLRGVWRRR